MNKLLRIFYGILLMTAISCYSFGQVRRMRAFPRERIQMRHPMPINRIPQVPNPGTRIEVVKENFISKRLNLSNDEARQFLPLYRRYQQELMAVRIQRRINSTDPTVSGTTSIDRELAYDQQLVMIRKHYRDEFLKILPPDKVGELYKSEREFNDELIKQLSERNVRAGD